MSCNPQQLLFQGSRREDWFGWGM